MWVWIVNTGSRQSSAANKKKALAVRRICEEVARYEMKCASLSVCQHEENGMICERSGEPKTVREDYFDTTLSAAPLKRKFPVYEEETLNNKYFSIIKANYCKTPDFLIVQWLRL